MLLERTPISSGLQEVVLLFPGLLRERGGAGPRFTPLLRTDELGGTLRWDDIIRRGFLGMVQLNPNRPYLPSGQSYTLAAHLKGDLSKDASAAKTDEEKKEETAETRPART